MSVLVIDDDRGVRDLICDILRHEGLRVLAAGNSSDGLHLVQYDSVDVVLTDLRLPGEDGIEILHQCRRLRPSLPVILITGFGSIESAVEAMRSGACDYITKPITREKILDALERVGSAVRPASDTDLLAPAARFNAVESTVVARSRELGDIFKMVEKIAPTKASVLLQGETGVGKEVIAKQIHAISNRRDGPFVRVNCGAIPESLFESELFGHERGAFTGAEQRRMGCFELAHGGTIFMDEVGELPRRVQVRLLHALQDGRFRRVGGTEVLDVDTRVIAATNRDLEADVQQGRFRKDLYFRLNVVSLRIPPLRERRDDIPALIEHFVQKFADQHGKSQLTIQAELLERLLAYDWPGNVRELSNILERAIILSEGQEIEAQYLPEPLRSGKPTSSGEMVTVPLTGNIEEIERHVIREMIERCHGNKAEAARKLGMHRRTLYRVMERAAPPSTGHDPQNETWVNTGAADCA